MKNIAKYLQIVVIAYFILYLIFFLAFDTIGKTFGMDPLTSDSMVKVFLTGFILSLGAWGAVLIQNKNQNDVMKKMQDEMNGLKAKIYDIEHPKVVEPKRPFPQKNQDDSSGILRPRQNFTDQ
jgi:p-aminobenzoyl-glutamate transporter AbgT